LDPKCQTRTQITLKQCKQIWVITIVVCTTHHLKKMYNNIPIKFQVLCSYLLYFWRYVLDKILIWEMEGRRKSVHTNWLPCLHPKGPHLLQGRVRYCVQTRQEETIEIQARCHFHWKQGKKYINNVWYVGTYITWWQIYYCLSIYFNYCIVRHFCCGQNLVFICFVCSRHHPNSKLSQTFTQYMKSEITVVFNENTGL